MRPFIFSFILFLFIFALILDLIHLEIVLFLGYLLPFRNIDYILTIYIYFLFTNFMQILPLLFLFISHHHSLGGFIVFYFCQVVYEAGVTCLFTYVDSPHFKIFTSWFWTCILIFIFFVCSEIFSKKEVFFLCVLNGCPEFTLCSGCYQLSDCSLSGCNHSLPVVLNLLIKSWSFFGFGDVSWGKEGSLLLLLFFLFFLLLDFDALEFDGFLFIL